MSRIVKSISFNLADPLEKSIYDFVVSKGNFSKVIKMILFSHMEGNLVSQIPPKQDKEEDIISKDIMSEYY